VADAHAFLTKVISGKSGDAQANDEVVSTTVSHEGVIGLNSNDVPRTGMPQTNPGQLRTGAGSGVGGAGRPDVHVGGFAFDNRWSPRQSSMPAGPAVCFVGNRPGEMDRRSELAVSLAELGNMEIRQIGGEQV
jgi:hypothetical protein